MNKFDRYMNELTEIISYTELIKPYVSYDNVNPKTLKQIRKRCKKELEKLEKGKYDEMNYLTEEATEYYE